jgi:hypothetical protein
VRWVRDRIFEQFGKDRGRCTSGHSLSLLLLAGP